jgi:saccharopine dehydrogenase-like NADP-dependent oxidoreductase
MKRIVLFGAGKSAACLIDYLTAVCSERNWSLTIGDADPDAIRGKRHQSAAVHIVKINVENTVDRTELVGGADLVISLLPPSLHILIARDCVGASKNLLTASYVDESIRSLSSEISRKKLFFLCEMGLDPGIDHMSAMQIVHRIKGEGGKISVFRSHTGGLVAPESDDNPWHYKISWNPANVVKAGSAGAVFKEKNEIIKLGYKNIFDNTGLVDFKPLGKYAYYPNRDSLAYIPVYGLESAHSFIRTTLRHPDYCSGWKHLVTAGLTNDDTPVPPNVRTIADWSKPLKPFVNAFNKKMYDQIGLFEKKPIPAGGLSSAKILQGLIEESWKMKENDKDMILMLHEFEYELKGENQILRSSLIVKGENSFRTAMAKTVGLPLGIAAKLILENKIALSGLHIPIIPEIYEPVLHELALEGIRFHEEII